MVAQAVNAGGQYPAAVTEVSVVTGKAVAGVSQCIAVADDQVKASGLHRLVGQFAEKLLRTLPAFQKRLAQLAPAQRILTLHIRTVAEVGHCGEASGCGDAQPGTSGLQIASGDDRTVIPGGKRGCGPPEKFIPVGADHQRKCLLRLPGKNDKTHTCCSVRICEGVKQVNTRSNTPVW